MGFSLSPTVTVREFDQTLTVPGLATSIAAAVGHFQWGPVHQVELVDNESTLVRKFGEPNDEHYADWFSSANFLAYSNNLKQVRVCRNISTSHTDLTFTATGGTITRATGSFVTDGYLPGDTLVVTGTASNDGVYIIDTVSALTINVIGDLPLDEGTANADGTLSAGAFNALCQTDALPTDGSEITEAAAFTASPRYIRNRDDLDLIAAHTELAPFYARCPGSFGNKIIVSAFNGARNEQAGQIPAGQHWAAWAYKNFFDYAPTGNEIWIAVEIDGNVVETFEGSQDSTSVSPLGGTDYYVELINRTSKYIFAVPPGVDVGISHQNTGSAATLPYTGVLTAGYDITPVDFTQQMEGGVDSAPRTADYQLGWDLFVDTESQDVNFLMQCGGGSAVGKYILENVANVRLDCVALLSPNEEDVVGLPDPTTAITALRASGEDFATSSSYGIIDGNFKQQYDKYNDVYRWVPFNGDMAGLLANTDNVRDPWWSPAGLNRGSIKNVFKVAFNPSKAQRDELYRIGINPITQFRGQGTVLWGDKTAQTKPSAFDRINVRRLFITIEKAIATAARYQLFEFNDEVTRNNFKNLVEPYLRNVQGRRGIYDFRVVCDETNNTGEVIDRNEFVADIYVKPNRSINEIQLNFVAVKTGVLFEEVILSANA